MDGSVGLDVMGKRPFRIYYKGEWPWANLRLHDREDRAPGINQVEDVVKPVQQGNGRWLLQPLLHIWGEFDCGDVPTVVHAAIVTYPAG